MIDKNELPKLAADGEAPKQPWSGGMAEKDAVPKASWRDNQSEQPSDGTLASDGGTIGVSTDTPGDADEVFDKAVNGKPT